MTTVIDTLAIRREAKERMKLLNLAPVVQEEYLKGNLLKSYNERLHFLTPYEKELVEEVERDFEIFIYHVIQINGVYHMLYISGGDWETEQSDARFFHPDACICAGDKRIFNQIGVRSTYGVLHRIY